MGSTFSFRCFVINENGRVRSSVWYYDDAFIIMHFTYMYGGSFEARLLVIFQRCGAIAVEVLVGQKDGTMFLLLRDAGH